MPKHPHFRILLPLILVLSTTLGACSKPATPAAETETKAAPASNSGAIVADTSNDRCKLIPPEQVAEYKAAHDLFSGAPGLEPQFTKGQLFRDENVISFKWDKVAQQPLGISVELLRNCSQVTVHNSPLYETPEGSGMLSTPLHTGNSGSSYPSGTPAVVRVTWTEVDMQTMKGKTTVIGEYTVRLEEPKE